MVAKAFGKITSKQSATLKGLLMLALEFDTKLNFELCYKTNELQEWQAAKFYRLRKDDDASCHVLYQKRSYANQKSHISTLFNWMYAMLQVVNRQFEEEAKCP